MYSSPCIFGLVALLMIAGCGRRGFEATERDAATGPDSVDGSAQDGALPADLVASWTMEDDPSDGTIEDSTSNDLDARCIVGASCPAAATGAKGSSIAFDGVDKLALVTYPSSLDAKPFTVAGWFYVEDVAVNMVALARPYGATDQNTFAFLLRPTSTCFTSESAALGALNACWSSKLPTQRWVHVAGTWDGMSLTLFVDGLAVRTVPAPDVLFDNHDIVLGGDQNSGSFVLPFRGRLDELKIFSRALGANEIGALVSQ